MARATRSGAAQQQEKDKHSDSSRQKHASKKRKRASLPDNDDQPPLKQHQPENGIADEQNTEEQQKPPFRGLPELELAGDTPLIPADAQKILDILELADTQGLLDRVFPLPSFDPSEPCTSKSQSGTYSLRTLLRESSQHPLRVLRAAVQNLFPVSYNARSRTSSPATQQLRFCHLAQSLLAQASFHSVPLPLDIDSILPDVSEQLPDTDTKPVPRSPRPEKPSHSHYERKYALMQRLPSGTWWSSLNSDLTPASGKTLTDLQTANAELVAILPSSNTAPSDPTSPESLSTDKSSTTTLGAYSTKKPPGHKQKLPGPRRGGCGSFLDYGPYTSFAPSFEQEGVEVGRSTLGEVYWSWEGRKKRWSEECKATSQPPASNDSSPASISDCSGLGMANGVDAHQENGTLDDDSLGSLLSQDQLRLLKEALDSAEIEAGVQELLERNANALKRLEELQNMRLVKPGGFTAVEEGSEEWETAQGIFDSLTVLASLRPRSSDSDAPPLVPSASALRKLHRTLPITPTRGWHGTLPSTRSTALRDDSTLYIKSTATTIPSNPPATSTPTPTAQATPTTTTAAPSQPYSPYAYNYATPYRTGYQFKAPQTYYPNAYTPQTTGQTQTTSQYYPSQQYNTTGQQQYAYSWYQYTPQAQPAAASTANAQASTSQSTPTLPTSYASFFSANAQTPGPRAVANTVLTGGAAKPYQPAAGTAATAAWPAGAPSTPGYPTAPTLPPHMRPPAIPSGQAGVATGTYAGGYTPAGYYGSYQPTPSPAQS